MRAIFLACLVASSAATAQPTEAPILPITKGTAAPDDGVFMTVPVADHLSQVCKAAQLENTDLRQALQDKPSGLLPSTGLLVGGAVLAFAAGFLVGWVTFKK